MGVIEVEGLRKDYRRSHGRVVSALAGLDLTVPAGGVFGFLGPNGSGKTTTIRCLLGLARPSAGSCSLLGAEVPGQLAGVIQRVGVLVETPGINPGLSGRKTLEVLASVASVSPSRVGAVLGRVGLAERAGDAVRGYSLGMRQRLGIAVTLLKDPEVLVLDEPANGLDPAGIREVRDLVRSLGAEGRTVFLSSHLLGEVQQVCDRVAIIARGRTVVVGPVGEVLTAGRATALLVRVSDTNAGLDALTSAGITARPESEMIRVEIPPEGAEAVTRALVARGLYPTELRPDRASLEDVFFALTEGQPTESDR